jgi:hypothetical protein
MGAAAPQARRASRELAVPQPKPAMGPAAPQARRASIEAAVPQPRPALGPAVPQARRASIQLAVPQPSPVIMGIAAARRAKCAAVTGAAERARPQAILALKLFVNSICLARLVLVAESRTRMGRGVT